MRDYCNKQFYVSRLEVFTTLKIQTEVFWAVTPCNVVGRIPTIHRSMLPPSSHLRVEDGGNMDI